MLMGPAMGGLALATAAATLGSEGSLVALAARPSAVAEAGRVASDTPAAARVASAVPVVMTPPGEAISSLAADWCPSLCPVRSTVWALSAVRGTGGVAVVAVPSPATGASHLTELRVSAVGRLEETGATPWKERVQCEHCSDDVFRDQGRCLRCLAGRMVDADRPGVVRPLLACARRRTGDAGFVASWRSGLTAWRSADSSAALVGAATVDRQAQPDNLQWKERSQCMHWDFDVFRDHCWLRCCRTERAALASHLRA